MVVFERERLFEGKKKKKRTSFLTSEQNIGNRITATTVDHRGSAGRGDNTDTRIEPTATSDSRGPRARVNAPKRRVVDTVAVSFDGCQKMKDSTQCVK